MKVLSVLQPLTEREFNISETMQILRHNMLIYFSWGVSKVYNVNNGGLLLKVNGHHHKGYVFITLGWEDLYNVYLIKTNGDIKDTIKGLYFDQLTEVIDNKIERIPDYHQ